MTIPDTYLSQTLQLTAIYAYIDPLAPPQLIGSPMAVPWVVSEYVALYILLTYKLS